MTTITIFVGIFFLFIAAGVSLVFLALYNILVRNEELVNEAWAKILALVDRKSALIPVLIDAVKAYAGHEKSSFEAVASARAAAVSSVNAVGGVALSDSQKLGDLESTQAALSSGLAKLTAVAEQYPELKASGNYLALQDELRNTEDRITAARQVYNSEARTYNSRLRYFPANIVAAVCRFEKKCYYGEGVK